MPPTRPLAPAQQRAAAIGGGAFADAPLDLALDLSAPAHAAGFAALAATDDLADPVGSGTLGAPSGYRIDTATPQGQAFTDDMARMFRNLGVVSFRASVVDIDSLCFHTGWTIHSTGNPPDGAFEASLDGAFPGAAATVARLCATPIDTTLVQRMSPRRWVFAWRIDERRAVMAMAHFLDGRVDMAPVDTAVVRLVCDAGIQAEQAAPKRLADEAPPLGPVWPQVERRRRVVPRWIRTPALVLVCMGTLLAGWLTLVSLPQARHEADGREAELDRLLTMADRTVTRSVAAAMASGDYGEVQTALAGFATLGYFEQAVVTNTSGRVVAIVGAVSGARIGDPPPADLVSRATATPLIQASASNGQLMIYRHPVADEHAQAMARLQWQAGLALGTGALAALLMAARWPHRRRPRAQPQTPGPPASRAPRG